MLNTLGRAQVDQHRTASDLLDRLTPKERAVLDLVLHHRPTKEIARELGLAPNTVDMRLRSAREKLGTTDRNGTARVYLSLLATCGKTTCGPEVLAAVGAPPINEPQENGERGTFVLEDAGWIDRPAPWDTMAEQARSWSSMV